MTQPDPSAPLAPPIARRVPSERVHHGDVVVDEYEWLRDKESPDTIAHLEAENAWTDASTSHLEPLRDAVFEEIKARTQETDLSVPTRHGAWWYYARTVEGSQYALRCRCPASGDGSDPSDWTPPVLDAGAAIEGEQVLLDANDEAEGHDFFSLGAFSLSLDGTLLAWSVDVQGDERYTIRVKDLRTGEVLPDEVSGASAGVTWSRDATHLFYTTVDDAWRPDKIWRHALGSTGDDTLVFHEPDERYFIGVGSSHSDEWLMIGCSSKVTSEVLALRADDPEGEFRVVVPRRDGVEYSLEHARIAGEDVFLVLHNATGANFALGMFEVDSVVTDLADVPDLIPASDATRLDDVDVFAGQVLVSYRRDALTRVGVMLVDPSVPRGIGPLQEILFDEELFSSGVGANAEWDQPVVRLGYGSFTTPSTVLDYVVATGELVVRKQAVVVDNPLTGTFRADDYVQTRAWATADDGTQVPVSIVRRRDTPVDGTAPALLYGYGSYEISIDPGFSIPRLSLLDRGFVFAVAHVRGGGEMGRHWYDDGKMLRKKNSFTDFVAAARLLVDEGWTSADRLVAEGGSAGGLLMGAVANLAPEAFGGVLASVPFVDALTSILDPSLPLTVIEWDEWGDPLHDADVYAYMKSYSPYENVTAQAYPSILAVTSLHDTRVLYVEPAKWVARLRATATGNAPVLLKTEMHAGHGGVSGRYASWRERAFELAWIIDTAGAPHAPTVSA